MIEGIPSITAVYIATVRGIATCEPSLAQACHDELAQRLVPRPLRVLLRGFAASSRAARAIRFASRGWFDHLALRTGVIDRAVQAALERGAKQLVLLGAGLDARGHRLTGLSEVVVFEVDHPSTQAYKRKRAASLVHPARELRYAASDFAQTSLAESLAAVGFNPEIASCVVWEGVTMYLPETAIEETLFALSQLCAAGSTLIASYLTPVPVDEAPSRAHALRFKAIAEPVLFAATPEAMRDRFETHGFHVQSDVQPLAEAASFGIESLPFEVRKSAQREHVLVAERRVTRAAEST